MSTEEVIREVVSKSCPFHGKHATVKVQGPGQISISTCCAEFHQQMANIVTGGSQKTLTVLEYHAENRLVHA
jgi:hypothetical protein